MDAALLERFFAVQQVLGRRWPEDRIAPTLERIARGAELLGDPQAAFPSVLIAGTNGKTSTARMVDQLARTVGLHTGRFTSPHLATLLERINLFGEPISMDRFIETYDEIEPFVEMVDAESIGHGGPAMSTFEVLTLLAFAAFSEAPVDMAVVEVGMGGTWDATNIMDPAVAVIAPVGLDHMQYLGSTIAQVAGEKAGIIKPDGIVVVARQDPVALEVISRRAEEVGAQVVLQDRDFRIVQRSLAVGGQYLDIQGLGGLYDEIILPLHGEHQADNAALALVAFECFLGGGHQRLDVALVREAMASVTSPGRLEVLRSSPTVIVDAAHNAQGVRAAMTAVEEAFGLNGVVCVLAAMADKDVEAMAMELAPFADAVVVTSMPSPRAMVVDELGARVAAVLGHERVVVTEPIEDALTAAVAMADDARAAGSSAGVVVLGSVVLAGAARTLLGAGAVDAVVPMPPDQRLSGEPDEL